MAFHFHCIHRAELVNVPSFSANPEQGSWNTSVLIWAESGPPYGLVFFESQKVAVSIS